jgi:hypothetical protein
MAGSGSLCVERKFVIAAGPCKILNGNKILIVVRRDQQDDRLTNPMTREAVGVGTTARFRLGRLGR